MQISILGKRWRLSFSRIRDDGQCDHPETPGKEIRINQRLTGQRRLEIIVHEILHAALWSIDEEYIEHTARDVARVLWRLGYRIDSKPDA